MSETNVAGEYETLSNAKEQRRVFLREATGVLGALTLGFFAVEDIQAASSSARANVPPEVIARCRLLSAAASSQDMDAAIRQFGEEAKLTPDLTKRLKSIAADELRALSSINRKLGSVQRSYDWVTSW